MGTAATTVTTPSRSLPLMDRIGWLHRDCGTSLAPSLCTFDAWYSDAVQCQPSSASRYRAWTQGRMHGHEVSAAQVQRKLHHAIYRTGGTRTQQGVADAVRCVLVPCSNPLAECSLHMAVQADR